MKKMSKVLALVLALVISASALVFSVSAEDAYSHSHYGGCLLPGGQTVESAKTIALGEDVFNTIPAGTSVYYKVDNDWANYVTFTVRASSKVAVKVWKDGDNKLAGNIGYNVNDDGTLEPVGTLQKRSDIYLENAYHYIEVKSLDARAGDVQFSLSTRRDGLPTLSADINTKAISVISGQGYQLRVNFNYNVKNINCYWRVMDNIGTTDVDESKIITVTENGYLTVNDNSFEFNKDTVVTVGVYMYYCGEWWYKTCEVTAQPKNIFLSPYYDMKNPLILGLGAYVKMEVTSNIGNVSFEWSTSKPGVVEVVPDKTGAMITAKSHTEDSVVITCKIAGTQISRSFNVIVDPNHSTVMGVTFDKTSVSTRVGEGKTLNWKVHTLPTTIAPVDGGVTFTSNHPEIATVDANGKVTGVSEGTAVITVTTNEGQFKAECTVTVKQALPNWLQIIVAPIRAIISFLTMIFSGN